MIKLLDTRRKLVRTACISMLVLSACGSENAESITETTVLPTETATEIAEITSEAQDTIDEEETTADVTESEAELQGDYIFPNSEKEFIPFEDANSKSDEELRIGRNEIYARHGRKFSDEKLQAYFDCKDWYQGTISPEEFDESILSLEEKRNIRSLSNLEGQRAILNTKQAYRYDYDSTAFANVNGMQRQKMSYTEGEYFIVTPVDFDHINVEVHTYWGDSTIEFSRVGFDFEGAVNYNNISTDTYKDGYMELGKNEASLLIDGNDCIDYYTR